jgi:hypothetical protein
MIVDNESTSYGSGSLKFSKSQYDTTEGSTVELTVQRTGGAQGTATVEYYTMNGSALSGADYTASQGTLTFLEGESGKLISIPILSDSLSDGGEQFNVTIQNPSAMVSVGTPSTATVVISQ